MKKLYLIITAALLGVLSGFATAPTLVWYDPDPTGPAWSDWEITSVRMITSYWDTGGEAFTVNPEAVGTIYRNGFAIGEAKFKESELTDEENNHALVIDPGFTLSKWSYSIRVPAGTVVTSSGATNEATSITYPFPNLDPEGFTKPGKEDLVPLYEAASVTHRETESEVILSVTWNIKESTDLYGNTYLPKTVRVRGGYVPFALANPHPNATLPQVRLRTYDQVDDRSFPVVNGQVTVDFEFLGMDYTSEWEAYADLVITIPEGWIYDPETFAGNESTCFEYRLAHSTTLEWYYIPSGEYVSVTPEQGAIVDRSTGSPLDEIRIDFKDLHYYNFKTPERIQVPEGETVTAEIWEDDKLISFTSDPIRCEWQGDDSVTLIISFKENPLTLSGDYSIYLPYGFVKTQAHSSAVKNYEFTYMPPEQSLEPVEPVEPDDPDNVKLTANISGHGLVIASVAKGKPVEVRLIPAEGWAISDVALNGEDVTSDVAENGVYTIPALDSDATLDADYVYAHDVDYDYVNGVGNLETIPYRLDSDGLNIVITGLKGGEHVSIYTFGGLKVAELPAVPDGASQVSVALPAGQVYLFMIDGVTIKYHH